MEHSAEQLEGTIEVGGRVTVNRDEELVADWLRTQGHAVRHLTNGDDPPDLVVDENIAVEVTTIASFAFTSVWDFMEGVCRSLGPAEGGRGYFISVNADEDLLQGKGRKETAVIKRELRFHAKIALRNHYRNPNATLCVDEPVSFFPLNGLVRLPHGVDIRIIGPMRDNPDDVKYEVAMGGTRAVWVVPHLVETIQAAIHKKTNNRMIQERIADYPEWWLVVTDPQYSQGLAEDDVRTTAEEIHYGAPWRRIFLASTRDDRVGAVRCLTEARS